jgi:hypothetical protein
MLGASVALFALVSGFVAFGSWPGAGTHTNVDQVLLREVATPKPKQVAVRADAVVVAQRAAASRSAAQRRQVARAAPGTPVAGGPAVQAAPGTPVTTSPSAPASAAPTPQTQAETVTRNVDTTTRDVKQQAQQQVQNVTNQVNDVVDQVIGPPTPNTVSGTVQDVTKGVDNAAGSLLGG